MRRSFRAADFSLECGFFFYCHSLHIDIAGMHCEKCSASVTEALNKLDGVRAEVSLQDNSASAKLSKSVSSRAIKEAVGDRGFEVTHIQES